MTLDEVLSDPVFLICAPIGVIVIVALIVPFGGGYIDI